jgi:outer membrane protein assembly complex protein YaeT
LLALFTATAGLSAQEQGERVVRELSFVGNKALDDLTLSSAIATTNSSWWARFALVRWVGLGEKRYFSEVEFRRDVVRLILLYRQSGYMSAVVDTVVRRAPRNVYIQFRIHEGEPVRITRLDVRGVEGIFNVEELKKDLPLRVGDAFNRFLLQASADTIAGRLKNSGYPYAEVLRNFDSEAGALRAEVDLDAQPGPRMRVGEVVIQGLHDVDTGTVRRVMSVRPGARFQQNLLYVTQRDLYSMGMFSSVNVVLIDSLRPQQTTSSPADSAVRVLIQLQEGPRHQTRIGFGYATVECFRLQTGWTARNFFGGARSLDLSARFTKLGGGFPLQTSTNGTSGIQPICNPFAGDWTVDTLNYQLNANLRKPAFLSRTNVATLGLTAERSSQYGVYTREAIGGDAAITFNTRSAWPLTLGYYYSVGRTSASDAVYCGIFRICDEASRHFLRDRRHFGALSISLTRDRVNNILDPSRGSLTTLTLLNASHIFGSQVPYEFNRGEFEIAKYYPIGRRTVFGWRVRAGAILPRNIDLSGQQVGYVPPDQRFYGGGPNTVRGYGLNEMGPRVYVISDTSGSALVDSTAAPPDKVWRGVFTAPTGGNTLIVLNAELRLPSPVLPQRMRLGLFVDAGQVWERGSEAFPISGLRVTPGAGLRFATPLGPVRVDAAYNGYPIEQGPLLYAPPPDTSGVAAPIVQIRDAYPPSRAEKSFWQKVVVQFAIGHAF